MRPGDTSLGGEHRKFPDTTLGLISRIRKIEPGEQEEAWDELCRRYWKPVYSYVRIAWAKSNEDAKDLTQAFFLWLLEGEALQRYLPDRGAFHRYLKTVLRRFVGGEQKALKRLKRGGGVKVLRLEDDSEPLEEILPDPKATDPEQAFDRAWALSVVQRAIQSIRDEFRQTGREKYFRVYEEYELAPKDDRPTYAGIAARIEIKETDVANYLYATREAVRQQIRSELSLSISDPRELEDEWNALLRFL